ncbi:probable LRR receptor-like serine/threonine-protein kinase At3g47570 [Pistacia vera]|uniref:probable LRR receptor-like serine/threonine-protein kinase At3g47570 n=1 Tax=Pistacia vera TaxID=55513 RepID=UPI001262FF31|nr:probable LRR receptor-like serine/threonine-protein kinase At3g47570 [Pistacia vera]
MAVAVKVLNLQHRGASRSFLAECEALRSIRHRNLVKIITACASVDFQGNDFKALVYEFMVNGSLKEWLHPNLTTVVLQEAPRNLNFLQRLDIATNVACAVDYLHNHGQTPMVHCDLKPSNVLLDDELTGHVSDFGLARFLPEGTHNLSSNQTSSIGVRGTVGYVAPEYGMGSEVSTYGDVYSYGILLLETFTGKRPTDEMFNGDLDLHNFVKAAIPERVIEIVDPVLLLETEEGHTSMRSHNIRDCLISIFGIGVTCSSRSPSERMNMNDVTDQLHPIKNKLLQTPRRGERLP